MIDVHFIFLFYHNRAVLLIWTSLIKKSCLLSSTFSIIQFHKFKLPSLQNAWNIIIWIISFVFLLTIKILNTHKVFHWWKLRNNSRSAFYSIFICCAPSFFKVRLFVFWALQFLIKLILIFKFYHATVFVLIFKWRSLW